MSFSTCLLRYLLKPSRYHPPEKPVICLTNPRFSMIETNSYDRRAYETIDGGGNHYFLDIKDSSSHLWFLDGN